jgi:hypothetical protein
MFSAIKSLFTSDKVVEGISSGLDKSFYTEEEKRDHFQVLLSLYEPFKVAQRLLALTFSIPYALAWLVAFMASFWIDVSTQLTLLTDPDGIAPIVLMINVFYFGGGALEGVVRKFSTTKQKNLKE